MNSAEFRPELQRGAGPVARRACPLDLQQLAANARSVPRTVLSSCSRLWASGAKLRGRDASYLAPPAQIRTCGLPAYGSHLGCVTAKRTQGSNCRMRSSACDTRAQL